MTRLTRPLAVLTFALALVALLAPTPAAACPTCASPSAWGATPCLTTNCSICGYCAYCCGRLGIGCQYCCRDCALTADSAAAQRGAATQSCAAASPLAADDEFERLFGGAPAEVETGTGAETH